MLQPPFDRLHHLRSRSHPAVNPQPEPQILQDRQVKNIGPLEHHPHLAPKGDQIGLGVEDIFVVDDDLAFDPDALDQIVHPVEAPKQRALAAARRPDHRGDVPVGDPDRDLVQRQEIAVVQIQVCVSIIVVPYYPNLPVT